MEISDATAINFHSSGSVPCLLLAITVGSRMSLKTGGKDSCLVVLFTFSHKQLKAGMIMHILIKALHKLPGAGFYRYWLLAGQLANRLLLPGKKGIAKSQSVKSMFY